jgi:hypothetical protein
MSQVEGRDDQHRDVARRKNGIVSRPGAAEERVVLNNGGALTLRAQILALLFFAALPARAEDAKLPCNLDAAAVIVCESGGRIFRVIREALSRSGRHAVAWALVDPKDKDKIETREGEQYAPNAAIDNVLIHLPDGAMMKILPGGHFGDAQRYNHYAHHANWSEFDQWLVVVNDSKWESDDASVYHIDDEGAVGPFDLMPFCAEAAHKFFARGGKRFNWEAYLNSVSVKDVTLDGDVSLVFTMQVPKGEGKDDLLESDIVLHMKREKDSLTAKLTSIRRRLPAP